jgi:serine/threonine protein kinase
MGDMHTTDLLGKRIGHVRVVHVLGEGGMGSLYVGYDEKLGRRVALKAIRGDRRLNPEVRGRFQREAQALSQLDHPNICRIYGYVEDEDTDFLVLELIEGKDLRSVIRDGKTTLDERLALAEQIASALAVAHERAIVHRDIKPGNVVVTTDGRAKVLDFGLARTGIDENAPTLAGPEAADSDSASRESSYLVTKLGTVVGTLAYMSPEQARGEPVTTASDMYSFGLLFQELLTGEAPRDLSSEPDDLVRQAREGRSQSLAGVDADLALLINRLKAKSPATRPPAIDTVERIRWIRSAPARRRRRIARVAGFAILSLLVVALATATWRANREAAYNAESWRRNVESLAENTAFNMKYAILTSDGPLARLNLPRLGGHL